MYCRSIAEIPFLGGVGWHLTWQKVCVGWLWRRALEPAKSKGDGRKGTGMCHTLLQTVANLS